MQVDAVQRHLELREGVEPRFLRAPVEAGRASESTKLLQIGDVGAVGPGLAGRLVGNRVRARRSRRSSIALSATCSWKGCTLADMADVSLRSLHSGV